jgi:hypothetical protein
MAPLHFYREDRDTEIAMVRTAAPEGISRDATVMALGEHGYMTAVEGKTSFVCLVERSWIPQRTLRASGIPSSVGRFASLHRRRALAPAAGKSGMSGEGSNHLSARHPPAGVDFIVGRHAHWPPARFRLRPAKETIFGKIPVSAQ